MESMRLLERLVRRNKSIDLIYIIKIVDIYLNSFVKHFIKEFLFIIFKVLFQG